METTFDLVEFQQRLDETIEWCLTKAPVSDLQHGLRAAALVPSEDIAHPTRKIWKDFPRPWTDEMWREYRHAELQAPQVRQMIVDEVARKRRSLLGRSHKNHLQLAELFGKGRLLTYEPERNMYDGAAENASAGFFDGDNVPPWDIWLMYVVDSLPKHKTYLIAWVPPECLKPAQVGIEANPEQCIRWAEDVDAEFVHQLRDASLLR